MMSWCCTTSHASEACAAPTEKVTSPISEWADMRRWLFAPNQMSPKLHDLTGRRNNFDTWCKVVEDFSTRSLTHEPDTLPALEGIAQIMKKAPGCRYVYGLWEDDFQQGLSWRVRDHSRSPKDKPEPLDRWVVTTPSWSWASCPGAIIEFHQPGGSYLKQVLPLGVRWYTSDEKSHISTTANDGVLQLTGALKKVRMRVVGEDDGYVELDDLQTGKEVGFGFLDHPIDEVKRLLPSSTVLRPVSCLLTLSLGQG